MRLKTTKRVFIPFLIFFLMSLCCAFTAFSQQENYYYASGKKIQLEIAADYLAARIETGIRTKKFITTNQALIDRFNFQNVAEFETDRIVLFKLKNEPGIIEHAKSKSTLTNWPRVEKLFPVFRAGEEKYLLILTDEFFVKLRPGVSLDQIEELNGTHHAELIEKVSYLDDLYLLKVSPTSNFNALEAANRYHKNDKVLWSAPNFWSEVRVHYKEPNDTYFKDQWHLQKADRPPGREGDLNAIGAWDTTMGSEDIVIAIIDDGVEINHEDLKENIFTNLKELEGKADYDDDKNGYIDDVHGWDFFNDDNDANPSRCDGGDPTHIQQCDIHGTLCAGVAAARIDNKKGVAGVAGKCKILPIKLLGVKYFDDDGYGKGFVDEKMAAKAFVYASTMADVLNCSFGAKEHDVITEALQTASENGREGRGCVIVFSTGNDEVGAISYPANLESVISVGCCTDWGFHISYSNWGEELDILAPAGPIGITTTDDSKPGYGKDPNESYTANFIGTSAAAPQVSAVAALVLSVNPCLKSDEVKAILLDTADKVGKNSPGSIDEEKKYAKYDIKTGKDKNNRYGYGKVNAFEAVKKAKETQCDHVDIYVRDDEADNGKTPNKSGYWFTSVDIKVDGPESGYRVGHSFDNIQHESAISSEKNNVYVQVHNRCGCPASDVTVSLFWTDAGTALPPLPNNFWKHYSTGSLDSMDSTYWHFIGSEKVENLSPQKPEFRKFEWTPPENKKNPSHFCLLAIINCKHDQVSEKDTDIGNIVRNNNNITLKNVTVKKKATYGKSFECKFLFFNPMPGLIKTKLRLEAFLAQELGWSIELDKFEFNRVYTLAPNEREPVTMTVNLPEFFTDEDVMKRKNVSRVSNTNRINGVIVTVIQERVDTEPPEIMGGIVFQLFPVDAGNWSSGLHLGMTGPTGFFNNHYDPGFSLGVNIDYYLAPRLYLVGFLGYNRFKSGFPQVGDTLWWNFSSNLKYTLLKKPLRPYVNAGPGIYISKTGSLKPGFNIGTGVDYSLNFNWVIELGVDYNHIFTRQNDTTFYVTHLGVIYRF